MQQPDFFLYSYILELMHKGICSAVIHVAFYLSMEFCVTVTCSSLMLQDPHGF